MRDAPYALLSALSPGNPLVIVFYPDLTTRDELVELVSELAPGTWACVRTHVASDAFARKYKDTVLLVTPDDEGEAVLELAACRDRLEDREAPAVLFLLRGSTAETLLEDGPLESWARGTRALDPEALAQLDPARERELFESETGKSPEEWLALWREGELADDNDNSFRYHRALVLADEAPENS